MTAENNRAEEARAMERIVNATRQVQAAFDTMLNDLFDGIR